MFSHAHLSLLEVVLEDILIGTAVEVFSDGVTELKVRVRLSIGGTVRDAKDPLVLTTHGDQVDHWRVWAPLSHSPYELATLDAFA